MITTDSTRFPTLSPQTATGRAAVLLDDLWARHDGEVSDMVRTMAGSAALLGGYLELSRAMKRSRLPRRTAETVSIAIQARLGCALCLDAHIASGRKAGLSDDDIALAVAGTANDASTAALVAYAVAVHSDPVSVGHEQIVELRSLGHRDRDLLDVIGLVVLNHLTGAFNLVAGLEPEEPMNTTTRLAAYGGVLAASFAAAAGIGTAIGPIDTGDPAHVVRGEHDPGGHAGETASPTRPVAAGAGTSLDGGGIRIDADRLAIVARTPTDYTFRLVDDRGNAIRDFDVVHDRRLHLIVASRDQTTYHHLHPEQADETWSVALPALEPGTYRVFADSRPTGHSSITLGVDLLVVEDASSVSVPPADTTSTVDGFAVILSGTPDVGTASLSFTVRRDGAVVATEPYLGAAGHLVVLRAGDLAYVHAHADDHQSADSGRGIAFDVSFPTPGTYRLFLDFAVDGTVRTAAFTVAVTDPQTPTTVATHEGH